MCLVVSVMVDRLVGCIVASLNIAIVQPKKSKLPERSFFQVDVKSYVSTANQATQQLTNELSRKLLKTNELPGCKIPMSLVIIIDINIS